MKKLLVILMFCLSSCCKIAEPEPNVINLTIIDKYYNQGNEWATSGDFTLYKIESTDPINGDVLRLIHKRSVNDIYGSEIERKFYNLHVGQSYFFLVTSFSTKKLGTGETKGEYRLTKYAGGKLDVKIVVE